MLKRNSRLFLLMLMLTAFLVACGNEDLAGTIEEAAETVGEVADEVAENADEVAETVEEVIEVDAAAPFAGETIEIIIPYGEGGGSDTWMRAIAPFLNEYSAVVFIRKHFKLQMPMYVKFH
ncbi:MAG: hypothetical protein AAGD96_05395 [Chloroflexota bacterium]